MAVRRFQQRLPRAAPVVLPLERDGEDVEDVVVRVALVDDRLGQEQRVRDDHHPPRPLVRDLARPDLQDRRGEQVLVDHVAPQLLDLDPVADVERARDRLQDRPRDAEDQLLGRDHERDRDRDDRQRDRPQLLAPDHDEPEEQEQHEAVPRPDQPAAPQVRGLDVAADVAGRKVMEHEDRDHEHGRADEQSRERPRGREDSRHYPVSRTVGSFGSGCSTSLARERTGPRGSGFRATTPPEAKGEPRIRAAGNLAGRWWKWNGAEVTHCSRSPPTPSRRRQRVAAATAGAPSARS